MRFTSKWIVLLLGLSACGGQGADTIGAKPPENPFPVALSMDIASTNMVQGLDCYFKDQPHQTHVTDLGESTEIWVQITDHDPQAFPRFELKPVGSATIITIVSDASMPPAVKDLKLFAAKGRCSQSPDSPGSVTVKN